MDQQGENRLEDAISRTEHVKSENADDYGEQNSKHAWARINKLARYQSFPIVLYSVPQPFSLSQTIGEYTACRKFSMRIVNGSENTINLRSHPYIFVPFLGDLTSDIRGTLRKISKKVLSGMRLKSFTHCVNDLSILSQDHCL
mgnify:CR=1 FL=1